MSSLMFHSQGQFTILLALSFLLLLVWISYYGTALQCSPNPRVKHDSSQSGGDSLDEFLHLRHSKHYRELLNTSYIHNEVYYLWCGPPRGFQFHNYIAVQSVISNINPNVIHFYYEHLPVADRTIYNNWLLELRKQIPFFNMVQLTGNNLTQACKARNETILFVKNLLSRKGGIYVGVQTWITKFPLEIRSLHHHSELVYLKDSLEGFLMSKSKESISVSVSSNNLNGNCIELKRLNQSFADDSVECLIVTFPFYPREIMYTPDPLAKITRKLFYGSASAVQPNHDLSNPIPNICHYVWHGHALKVTFFLYVSVTGCFSVFNVSHVYFHSSEQPNGQYWEKLQKEHPGTVLWIYRSFPGKIWNVSSKKPWHIADILKVEIALQYGGIILDNDVIPANPIPADYYGYDTVLGLSHIHQYAKVQPVPRIFNLGFFLSKPNTEFMLLYQESQKDYIESDHNYNVGRRTYRIYEHRPELAKVDGHIQLKCLSDKCYAPWVSSKAESENLFQHHRDWIQSVLAFHWVEGQPSHFGSEEAILANPTLYGTLGRRVLNKGATEW